MQSSFKLTFDLFEDIIFMKAQEPSFASLSKSEDYKEQSEGFYHEPLPEEEQKKLKKYQQQSTQNSNNIILIIISLLFFFLIVISINYYFSQQIIALLHEKSANEEAKVAQPQPPQKNEELDKQLKEISENQSKIYSKLGELAKRIDKMSQETINVVDSDTSANKDAKVEANAELKSSIESISKELSVLKYDIGIVNKNIEKEALYTSTQLSSLKEYIIKDIEANQKQEITPQPAKVEKNKDDRSFEADFVTEAPDDTKDARFSSSSETYVDSKYVFDIPKKLWLHTETKLSYMDELTHKNNIYFANQSKFQIFLVNRTNYKTFLPAKTKQNVQKLITLLEKRVQAKDKTNLKYHLQSIIKKIILLNVLNENGGVMANGQFAMTEDLTWINRITQNPYVNRGNRGIKPQVVGFYSGDYSLDKNKQNIKPFPGMNEVDKYTIVFPALEDYFIAAEKNSRFITKLIAKIYNLLENPEGFKRERGHYRLNNLKGEDIYYEYFLIAVQTTMQDKQKQIDLANIDAYRHFAIDYYGLYLINCYYAPYKLKAFWGNGQSHKAFESLTQYSIDQLYANIGPMKYIARITPVDEMNGYLQDTKNGKRKFIMEGSFIQKIFYPNTSLPFIKNNNEKKFVNKTNEAWSSLPKIIWVFWDKGLSNAAVNNQICVENLRRMGKLTGFTVNEVNLSNINNYLDADTLAKIKNSLTNAKLKIYPQSQGDLYRLALLAKYGGIYMDASFIALQNFDWLVNIGKYPSQYIFNRFGHLPKVFMMWHPHYGSPLQWTINEKFNIKSQWHLAYQNNFIAAEKGSELIIEWFELLLQLYLKPYSEVEQIFQNCLMYSHKWSTSNWHYLIPMDTVKCVIGRREVQLLKHSNKQFMGASDYYKIWSMSGYLGQQKLRSNTNFENPGSEDNLFVYRYSQEYVEGLIGKIRHVAKFYSSHNRELTLFVSRHMDGNFSSAAHPDSIFMRHMWNSKFKLEQVNFYPRLKVLP